MRCVGHTQEMAAKDENLGMPSMTAALSTRAVLSVVASVVEDAKQGGGDIPDAVKSRLLYLPRILKQDCAPPATSSSRAGCPRGRTPRPRCRTPSRRGPGTAPCRRRRRAAARASRRAGLPGPTWITSPTTDALSAASSPRNKPDVVWPFSSRILIRMLPPIGRALADVSSPF